MKQTELDKKAKYVKIEEKLADDADVIKLDVGESLEGLLLEKKPSDLFGYVYKIKKEEDPRIKILCGTTVLNSKFANIDTDTEVLVERLKGKKNKSGRDYQDYDVWFIP